MSENTISAAYATAAEADSFLSGRSDISYWTALSTAAKNAFLRNATQRLDLCMRWFGQPASDTQSLQWPRKGVVDVNGNAIAENVIPEIVKNAAIEEALRMSRPEFIASQKMQAAGLEKVSLGGMSISHFADNGYICLRAWMAAQMVGKPRSYVEVCGKGPSVENGYLSRG